jgi:hypothetical protein
MSAEEMRTELEMFVNEGLREGWGGWPLKQESDVGGQALEQRLRIAPLRILRSCVGDSTVLIGRRGTLRISSLLC